MLYRQGSTNVSFVSFNFINFLHVLFPLTDGKFLEDASSPPLYQTVKIQTCQRYPKSPYANPVSFYILLWYFLLGILPSNCGTILTCIQNPSSESSFTTPSSSSREESFIFQAFSSALNITSKISFLFPPYFLWSCPNFKTLISFAYNIICIY